MQSVTRHDSEHPTIKGHGVQPGNRYPQKAPSLVTKRVQQSEILRHQTADRRPHHSHRSSREAQDNQHPFSSIQRWELCGALPFWAPAAATWLCGGMWAVTEGGKQCQPTLPNRTRESFGQSSPSLTAEPSLRQPHASPAPAQTAVLPAHSACSLKATWFVLHLQ